MKSRVRPATAAVACTFAMALGACGGDDGDAAQPTDDPSTTPSSTADTSQGADATESRNACNADSPAGTFGDDWVLQCAAGVWQYAADNAPDGAIQATMSIEADGNLEFVPKGSQYIYQGMLDPEAMTVELLPLEGDQVVDGDSLFFELTWLDDSYQTLIVKGNGEPMEFARTA